MEEKKTIKVDFNPKQVKRAVERKMEREPGLIFKLGLLLGIIEPEEKGK